MGPRFMWLLLIYVLFNLFSNIIIIIVFNLITLPNQNKVNPRKAKNASSIE